ncbi:hypothetical protein [Hymenobacter chitinivorans]|uniref:Lipoprotein n=1 Tax=Hymenobacter chitinivorans DSM 11115 TaxID=1121954 RepID=A0A2M9BQ90_9BACT|nr:hypothetical protein [Hymenobacter chitinivorans]PJJ60087.1 hypothetical protein CLV45_1512 [Hymenobacter chitinivorans DSM 11115]
MPTSSRLLLTAAVLATAATGCDSARETTTGQPNPTTSAAPEAAAAPAPGFTKTLTAAPYTFVVSSAGPLGQRQILVRAEQDGQELTTAQDSILGEVKDAQLVKLTSGPGSELLVFVEGAGSGSYGEVRGYWFGGKDWERMSLPKLSGPAARGYQGQDKFRLQGKEVVRSFPIYQETDANCCPSGGTRTIRYLLPDKSLTFRLVSVVNEAGPAVQ